MGDEYTEDVDTSSDMDTSEDFSEDVSDDFNDIVEDIPEDVPEDTPTDSEDMAEDVSEDILEDIPEAVSEDTSVDSEDMAEDVSEDIVEDIPENVPEDTPTDSEDMAEDAFEDILEDIPEDMLEDTSADSEDIVEDIPEDVHADTQSDIANETSSDETEETATDVSADEQPANTQDDMDDESPSDETEETVTDEQLADTQDDMDDKALSDETSDIAFDVSADEQPANTQDDMDDEFPSDETGDTGSDVSANEQSVDVQDNLERNVDIQEDAFRQLSDYMNEHNYGSDDFATYSQDPEWQRLHSNAYPDYTPPEAFSADTQKDSFRQLSDYMNEHNYGSDDFATYSQDPEWQRLHSNVFPDYTPPGDSSGDSESMVDHVSKDIYEDTGTDNQSDIANETLVSENEAYTYKQQSTDTQDNMTDEIQDDMDAEVHTTEETSTDISSDRQLVSAKSDMVDEASGDNISQSIYTVDNEIAEVAFNQELSREFEDNILSDPELTPEQKELMLGHFNEVNQFDNAETGEMQTGNLMSDIRKTSQLDDTDSVSDIQESSPFIHAMEISNSVINRYEKVRNNTALLNDEIGYQIAMNEMSKDLGKQVTDIDLTIAENNESVKVAEEALRNYSSEMELLTLNDRKYRELVENLQNTRSQSNQLRSQKSYLESLKNEASAEVSDEFKGMSFISPGGKPFSDTFSELINEQGAAYPNEIINDCGVCTMGNLANQHGGKYTEKSGLATGFGEYDYTQITDDMLPDEKIYALEHNGLTSLDSQVNILNKMGCEAVKYENGASFDDIVANISKGNSMSLNLYGQDLNSGSNIAMRPGRTAAALRGQRSVLPANHAVTIAGLAINPSGKPIGFFVNDTGGYGGKNNPSIFVSKAKYTQMLRRTVGISSIVCTGKKVFV